MKYLYSIVKLYNNIMSTCILPVVHLDGYIINTDKIPLAGYIFILYKSFR